VNEKFAVSCNCEITVIGTDPFAVYFVKPLFGWLDFAIAVGIKPSHELRLIHSLFSQFPFPDFVEHHQPVFSVSLETGV